MKVLIIGAGAAGLGAARQLKAFGFEVTVLEARSRLGGRVCTSDSLGHVDLGASIVTGLIGNPLDDLYRQLKMRGVEIKEECPIFNRVTGRQISVRSEEKWQDVFDDALKIAERRGKALLRGSRPDESLGFVIDDSIPVPKDDKSLGMLDWFYANLEYACACDLSKLSLLHWDQDGGFAFEGSHLMLADGYSSMIEPLADGINVITNQIVRSIEYSSPIEFADANSSNSASKSYPVLFSQSMGFNGSKLPPNSTVSPFTSPLHPSNSIERIPKVTPSASISIYGFGPTLFSTAPSPLNQNGEALSSSDASQSATTLQEGVRIVTESGVAYEADFALVTIPLGVLKQDWVSFSPPLPEVKKQAIDRLGFGLLNKIVLRFEEPFWSVMGVSPNPKSRRLGVDEDHGWFGTINNEPFLTREIRGFSYMFWNLHRFSGEPVLVALCSGKSAHTVEDRPKHEVIDAACEILRVVFKLTEAPVPVTSYVTQWSKQRFSKGSYSYVAKDSSGVDYDILAAPVNNRIFFAGEATSRCHPATVAGAYGSGLREAARLYRLFDSSQSAAPESIKFRPDNTNPLYDANRKAKESIIKRKNRLQRSDSAPNLRSNSPSSSAMSLSDSDYTPVRQPRPTRRTKRGFIAVAEGHSFDGISSSPSPTPSTPSFPSSSSNGHHRRGSNGNAKGLSSPQFAPTATSNQAHQNGSSHASSEPSYRYDSNGSSSNGSLNSTKSSGEMDLDREILTGSGNRYASKDLARQAELGCIGPPPPSFESLSNPAIETAGFHHALVQFIISKLAEYYGYGTFNRRDQVKDISMHIAYQVLKTEPSELNDDLKEHLTSHITEVIGFYHPTAVHTKRGLISPEASRETS